MTNREAEIIEKIDGLKLYVQTSLENIDKHLEKLQGDVEGMRNKETDQRVSVEGLRTKINILMAVFAAVITPLAGWFVTHLFAK